MDNKQFLVVGGSHGIGFAITKRLLDSGASVTVVSRTVGQLGELDESLASRMNYMAADVTTNEIDSLVIPEQLDGMVYCPGSINLVPLRTMKPALLRSDFELNVVAAVRMMQRATEPLKASTPSSVVLFSTVAVGTGLAMHTSVAAAKGAVEGITRTWAAEFAPKIRINCIAPALTETPLSERLLSNDAKRKAMASVYPLGRFGDVDDIASMATFLLGDESTWITGQVFGIDGGMSRVKT
ncbi:2,5-dichloro-2,5-cyclohexadiene-1,4-diol dehydrogenase [Planctomycetes bacterium CA13]|uniref:2,5-dichloro-2,5-cyclohexadiene-1,4-diol dehydrogenase n=1 Tax=Novipirellula herctigrandis TaxID=2527986 RepID=A0A5C5Z905_9BACT|nr:2,5-dichloro-2,5-cyclohexadiene-1,4-diol dehydrogenase [Planctomycetes bacterium CA13]